MSRASHGRCPETNTFPGKLKHRATLHSKRGRRTVRVACAVTKRVRGSGEVGVGKEVHVTLMGTRVTNKDTGGCDLAGVSHLGGENHMNFSHRNKFIVPPTSSELAEIMSTFLVSFGVPTKCTN